MSIGLHLCSLRALSPHELGVGLTVENSGDRALAGTLTACVNEDLGRAAESWRQVRRIPSGLPSLSAQGGRPHKLAGGYGGGARRPRRLSRGPQLPSEIPPTPLASIKLRVPARSKRSANLVVAARDFLAGGAIDLRVDWDGKSGQASEQLQLHFLPVMRVPERGRHWWRGAEPIVMASADFACEMMGDWWAGPEDLSAKLYFGWHADAFHFAADVTDDVHHQPYPDATMYHGDCVQLFLDVLKNGAVRYAEHDDHDFLLGDTPLGPLAYAASMPPDRLPLDRDVSLKIRRGPKGNRFYDLKLPGDSVKDLELAPGTVIGATVVVNDNDGHDRKGWLELTEEAGSTRDLRTFLNLVLCDEEFLGRPAPTDARPSETVEVRARPRQRTLRGDGLAETEIDLEARNGRGDRLTSPTAVRVAIMDGGSGILSSHLVRTERGRVSTTLRAPIGACRNAMIEALPLERPGAAGYGRVRFSEDREACCVLGRLDSSQKALERVVHEHRQGNLAEAREALLEHFRSRDDLKLTASTLREELGEDEMAALPGNAHELLEHLRGADRDTWDELYSGDMRFSRLAFWRELGQAYVLTGTQAFCRALVRALREYCRIFPASINGHDLPVPRASLNVGLSLSNAVAAYRGLLHWPKLSPDDHARFLRLLLVMTYYLETRHGPANWMTMEAAGLADFAFRFPEFRDRPRWIERVLFLCEGQALAQVRPDGMHYEQSPGYHLCALRSWQTVLKLAEAYGIEMSRRFRRTVERMGEAILYLAQPNWRTPNLGDSGEGDIRDTMRQASDLFPRADFRFTLGRDGPEDRKIRPIRKTSVLLPDAGYCVMRSDWSSDARYMVVDYGPWGYPNGHSHEDSLSLVVNAFGRKLIAETGVFSYARDKWRAYFAGAAGHNTCTVDGKGMGFVDAELLAWKTTRDYDFADGLHRGYSPIVHRRAVLFLKPDYWLLLDAFTGDRKRHTIHQHFHLMPSETRGGPQVAPGSLAARSPYRDANIMIAPVVTEGLRVEVVKGWYSGEGVKGGKLRAPEIRYVCEKRLPVLLATLLIPYRGAEPPDVSCTVSKLRIPRTETESFRMELRVNLPNRQDHIRLPLPDPSRELLL